jgi:hypothetical protein
LAETELINKTVQITPEQQKWLEEHEGISFSGWVREKLWELMKKEKESK